ncbi:NAD(P)/FAD-dependent oxidoreductase [Chakrabartyella piscis]|uniref:NAD(P)/FAD-dependent oxidoreductase n=1 Tax=Chakrabartyella piscis TaxID=2918914 RepID=UPI002958B687|nr:hypothetical protein [Chakrabartyella piscis]
MIRVQGIKLPVDGTEELLKKKVAKSLAIPQHVIVEMEISKRSLDARKKDNIHYVYVVDVKVEDEERVLAKCARMKNNTAVKAPKLTYELPKGDAKLPKRPIVVGFGPAGLFAGLILAQMGLNPVILERGKDVEARKEAVELFWKTGELDTENNVQFGEGGAGTFSDGKLTTRIKDPRCRKVLEELVQAGAPKEILYDAKPHIGTDLLRGVVKTMRQEIIRLGGEVHFSAKVVDFMVENESIIGVELADGKTIETNDVILAVGHSARDTFTMLYEKQVALEPKPFAMGVRVEHPQTMVDVSQYGDLAGQLPAAEYRLTHTTEKGRGVYTFCMCPGGYVVAAASEEGRLAVNGMSHHARDGQNANSALLVQVFPEDFPDKHPLGGMYFQRDLEEKAFVAGGSDYTAPVETIGHFLGKDARDCSVNPTYAPATKEVSMSEIFPEFMIEAMKEALPAMGRKLKGFDGENGILTAVESRSSSPVRIMRTISGESYSHKGLYPTGEGAGYAGGIVSAAVDGIAAAETVFLRYVKEWV